MIEKAKSFIWKIVTEPDNKTPCPLRLLTIAGIIQYLTLSGSNYFQHAVFQAHEFGLGFAAILGAAGVALGLKKDTPVDPK